MLNQLVTLRAAVQSDINAFRDKHQIKEPIEIASIEFESAGNAAQLATGTAFKDRLYFVLRNDMNGQTADAVGDEAWHKFVETTLQTTVRTCMNDAKLRVRCAIPMQRIARMRSDWTATVSK